MPTIVDATKASRMAAPAIPSSLSTSRYRECTSRAVSFVRRSRT